MLVRSSWAVAWWVLSGAALPWSVRALDRVSSPASGRPAADRVRSTAAPARLTPDELFLGTVRRVALWFDASRTNLPVVESTWEITATEGLSAGLVGQRMQYRVQAPERAQLPGRIGSEAFTVGRDHHEVGLWRPHRGRVWRARASVEEPLNPLAVPLLEVWLGRLPDFFTVRGQPVAAVNGVPCDVVSGTAQSAVRRWMGLPVFTLTFWLGQPDHRIRQFRIAVPEEGWALTALVRTLQERPAREAPRWASPMTASNRVEWVTLPRVRGAFPDAIHEVGLLRLVAP